MCVLHYAFDATNFVSLFYKIVKVDHAVSLLPLTLGKENCTPGRIACHYIVQRIISLLR